MVLGCSKFAVLSRLGDPDQRTHPCHQVHPRKLVGNRDQSTLQYKHYREWISLQALLPRPRRMSRWNWGAASGSCYGSWETKTSVQIHAKQSLQGNLLATGTSPLLLDGKESGSLLFKFRRTNGNGAPLVALPMELHADCTGCKEIALDLF